MNPENLLKWGILCFPMLTMNQQAELKNLIKRANRSMSNILVLCYKDTFCEYKSTVLLWSPNCDNQFKFCSEVEVNSNKFILDELIRSYFI